MFCFTNTSLRLCTAVRSSRIFAGREQLPGAPSDTHPAPSTWIVRSSSRRPYDRYDVLRNIGYFTLYALCTSRLSYALRDVVGFLLYFVPGHRPACTTRLHYLWRARENPSIRSHWLAWKSRFLFFFFFFPSHDTRSSLPKKSKLFLSFRPGDRCPSSRARFRQVRFSTSFSFVSTRTSLYFTGKTIARTAVVGLLLTGIFSAQPGHIVLVNIASTEQWPNSSERRATFVSCRMNFSIFSFFFLFISDFSSRLLICQQWRLANYT